MDDQNIVTVATAATELIETELIVETEEITSEIDENVPTDVHSTGGDDGYTADGNNEESGKQRVPVLPMSNNPENTYFAEMFESLTAHRSKEKSDDEGGEGHVKLVDFIEETVGIKGKTIRGRAKLPSEKNVGAAAFAIGTDGSIRKDSQGNSPQNDVSSEQVVDYTASNEFQTASEIPHPPVETMQLSKPEDVPMSTTALIMEEQPPPSVREKKEAPYNVVCTHITGESS